MKKTHQSYRNDAKKQSNQLFRRKVLLTGLLLAALAVWARFAAWPVSIFLLTTENGQLLALVIVFIAASLGAFVALFYYLGWHLVFSHDPMCCKGMKGWGGKHLFDEWTDWKDGGGAYSTNRNRTTSCSACGTHFIQFEEDGPIYRRQS